MDLIEAEVLAKGLIEEHLANYNYHWDFKWSHAKRVFGVCQYGRVNRIKLSKPLTALNSVERVTNTILHEIAHALDYECRGTSNHDQTWVRIAKSIGCDGKRCYDGSTVSKPKSKYNLVCNSCGKSTPKHRRPTRDRACGRCCNEHNSGKFSEDYLMVLKVN